jgi:hypothetical protein
LDASVEPGFNRLKLRLDCELLGTQKKRDFVGELLRYKFSKTYLELK